MWQEVLCAELSVGAHKKQFNLGQLANELINVLPRSPVAFKRLLVSQFDARKEINKADLHEMICFISDKLGHAELEKHLTDESGDMHLVDSDDEWIFTDSAIELCSGDSLFLDVYVNRHKVADLSETGNVEKYFSLQALQEQSGIFITHYAYKHFTLIFETNLSSNKLKIDVVRS
jgi:hypothetical protein